ncbi:MAG: hypothetical protein KBS63_05620 [Clostridiales bacterium]|nr:hypothetical protein [Candidatus Crickella caballi]
MRMPECMLIGAIICGIIAARRQPPYDRDYIIILGCGISRDGSLLPLIRGRVDRAIDFYNKQLAQTGKRRFSFHPEDRVMMRLSLKERR